jgi:hypothetical protein
MVDDSRTTEAMVDDRLCDNVDDRMCDNESTRTINSTSTISDRVVDGEKCSSSGVFEDFSGVDGKRTVQATVVADCHRGDCTRTMVVAVKPPSPPPPHHRFCESSCWWCSSSPRFLHCPF